MNKERKDAYVACLRGGTEMLLAWRAALSSERRVDLDAFEAKGLRLGLQVIIPKDVCCLRALGKQTFANFA